MRRLTEYADCAGCASKLDASLLTELTKDLPPETDPRVLVDYRTSDDAGVYRWSNGSALVQTVDFFTPMVDDPYDYGQIAAANALSDVYAMGGEPRTALAITSLPKDGPPAEVVRAIFRGGIDQLHRAGVSLLGGHTVTDPEIKFGYSVTGEVDPARIWTNAAAREGDTLLLTKPLGTGIIVRATRFGHSTPAHFEAAVRSMKQLNDVAAAAARKLEPGDVSACTDVTGFGLAGHSCEVAKASGVTLEITAASLPALPGALALVQEFLPCGGRSNLRFFTGFMAASSVSPEWVMLCQDPQTSGGLLFAMRPERVAGFQQELAAAGATATAIGRVTGPASAGGPVVRLV